MTSSDLITGIARPYGEGEPVDVLRARRRGRRDRAGRAGRRGRRDARRRRARPAARASSTCTPTCASRAARTPRPIETGSAAAALGGYTAVFAMPNTDPVADSAVVAEHVRRRGDEVGLVDVHPVGAVTVGLARRAAGRAGHDGRSAAGVRMFSDDGHCVHDPLLMRRALEYATSLDVRRSPSTPRTTADRAARRRTRASIAARLGLRGLAARRGGDDRRPRRALARDARARGCTSATSPPPARSSWCRCGQGGRGARSRAEVTPHHLLLTDARLRDLRPGATR